MAKRKKEKYLNQYKSFKNRLEQEALANNQKVVIQSAEGQKMSGILLDFIDPYAENWYSKDEMGKLISVAIIAWNASVLDPEEREKFIKETAGALPQYLRSDMKEIVREMIQRKEKYFANINRFIVDYQLTMTREGPHVVVASAATA